MLKALRLPEVQKKILFTLFVIVIFRVLAHVPVPGVDADSIRSYFAGNAFLGVFDMFSGGGFQNFSIITLSLGPYINASIIIQLFTTFIPKLEELSKEGESGREKLDQYTRLLTIPLAIFQAYGIYFLLNQQGVIPGLSPFDLVVFIATLTAGVFILVWFGDLITEYGVGNGISLLIFVGIVTQLPAAILLLTQGISAGNITGLLIYVILTLAVIIGVVLVNEGTRNIPLQYGRREVRSRSVSNYLPVKINQAGVIPIIFAVAVVSAFSFISGPLMVANNQALNQIGIFLAQNFNPTAFVYNAVYFLLVVGFTFFYTSVQFNPEKISDDIKKRGGFVPGVRPGKATKDYLSGIVTKLTLFGAVFLGLIAVLPYLIGVFTDFGGNAVGGTGLLIAVSVVLETVRQIEAKAVTRNYEGYLS